MRKFKLFGILVIMTIMMNAVSVKGTSTPQLLTAHEVKAIVISAVAANVAAGYDPACCNACSIRLSGCLSSCYYTNPSCYSACQAAMQECLENCEID